MAAKIATTLKRNTWIWLVAGLVILVAVGIATS